ncbi:helix-turn-helix domain-containing protein [Pedobacter sp. BS3]|uniref:helix-turn-helix domain-containing protein n=1 Tax=Pedobacter sp. BS3 TaxID=2567937 RepID=UPI001F5B63CA|nr:helix-turn-helix transcriptional regulator [Pedobacter sp. BS3]
MEKNKQDILVKFGKRLSAIRKEKKLSYRKIATLCNIDHSDIKRYEDGKKNLTLLTITELATGLGIHPKDLLDFDYGIDFNISIE